MGGHSIRGHRRVHVLVNPDEKGMRPPPSGYIPTCECGWSRGPVSKAKEAMQFYAQHLRETEERQCRNCGKTVHKSELPASGSHLCQACALVDQRENRQRRLQRDPAYERKDRLKRNYGLSIEDVDLILMFQGGVCAICGGDARNGRGHHPYVDHCHRTGVIRGILCSQCNQGIGLFGDDPSLLVRAIRYLTKTPPEGAIAKPARRKGLRSSRSDREIPDLGQLLKAVRQLDRRISDEISVRTISNADLSIVRNQQQPQVAS